MTDLSTNEVHSRTLTAFFDTREAARKASDDIVAMGIPREHVQITEGTDTTGAASAGRDAKGFWEELKDMFLPDEDRYGYAEGLHRGGTLLSVRSDEANYTRVMDVLDRDGAIDMDQREADWRQSGWTGYQAGAPDRDAVAGTDVAATSRTAGLSGSATGVGTGSTAAPTRAAPARTSAATGAAETLREGNEEVIPVYEEQATVAKRDVDHGRVRLRSYVVETPFAQQVSLRNEQVQVERRPVDRAVGATDAVFQDRVIEAEEHAEEAILAKEARVKEEISLRKTVKTENRTLSDTLRHTEVEVEDTRSGHALAGTGSTGAAAAGLSAAGTTGGADTSRIAEHMPVMASDGTQIGIVDHLDGPDRIKLAKNASPDGQHHYIPLTWVDHVDQHVHLNKAAAHVRANW